MAKTGLFFLALCFLMLTQAVTAHGFELITSQRTYPQNVSIDNVFFICAQISETSPCVKDTITVRYTYGMQGAELLAGGGESAFPHNVWCGAAWGTAEEDIVLDFECTDSLGVVHTGNSPFSIKPGNVEINPTLEFRNQALFRKHVGEAINIEVYVDDPMNTTVYYNAYNITLGIPYVKKRALNKQEGQFKYAFIIPANKPIGFLEFEAERSGDSGGYFMSYAAIPYSTNISVAGEKIMNGTVNISLDIDVDYGKINSVYSEVIIPNGTRQRIYLDHVNKTARYRIPMVAGNYTVTSRIYDSILSVEEYVKIFSVRDYELDVDTGIKVYEQGDPVEIKAGIIDSHDNPINSTVEIDVYFPEGGTKHYDNSDTTVENKYHKVVYPLDKEAKLGEYTVEVDALDEYGHHYTRRETFIVKKKEKFTVFTLSPATVYKYIDSMNEIKQTFSIFNAGNTVLDDFNITVPAEVAAYVTIDTANTTTPLEPGNSTSFKLTFKPGENMINRLYRGNITVEAGGVTEKIPVTLDVTLTSEMTVINKSVDAEALANRAYQLDILIENEGTRTLSGLYANLSGLISSYMDKILIPETITPDSKGKITVKLKPIESVGRYEGTLEIGANNVTETQLEITVEVFEDIQAEINVVDGRRLSMVGRHDALAENGRTITSTKKRLDKLQTDINEMRSSYNNGEYSRAKTLLAEIQNMADSIDVELADEEAALEECAGGLCGDDMPQDSCNDDGRCDDYEDCDCGDCENEDFCAGSGGGGGSTMIIIVIIIVVVLVVAVVATSIVPDDFDGSAPKR